MPSRIPSFAAAPIPFKLFGMDVSPEGISVGRNSFFQGTIQSGVRRPRRGGSSINHLQSPVGTSRSERSAGNRVLYVIVSRQHDGRQMPKSEIEQTISLIPQVNRLPDSLVGSKHEQRRW
jgi:hypothetical protein